MREGNMFVCIIPSPRPLNEQNHVLEINVRYPQAFRHNRALFT